MRFRNSHLFLRWVPAPECACLLVKRRKNVSSGTRGGGVQSTDEGGFGLQ